MRDQRVRSLVVNKGARFLTRDDFDASSLGVKFDFVFAHSVLSHAAYWQLEAFLRNTSKVLLPEGKILASLCLAEGNAYGNPGTSNKQDSMDDTWQYPGNSWFKLTTVETTAAKLGLTATYIPE